MRGRQRGSITAVAAIVLLASCRDIPDSPTGSSLPPAPRFEIVDGAHNSGNPHFFFLPPLVASPTVAGIFDSTQSPTVSICQLSGSRCGTTIAQFSMTIGTGSEVIRVDVANQLYVVNWDTGECSTGPCTLDPTQTYRLLVLVAGTELGHADVQVVENQGEAKNVATGAAITLVNGRTLPVKFRIEQGAVFAVGPSTQAQTIQTPTSAAGSNVRLVIPGGALSQPTGITVLPAMLPSGTNTTAFVAGAVFDFGPAGTTFGVPVSVAIQYNPANIPGGKAESTLRLFTLVNGIWILVPGSTVNTVTHVVTGTTSHFSIYGVNASASVSPGTHSSCGIGTSGTTVCWGDNSHGELGNGTTTTSLTPTRVVAPSGGFTQVTVGEEHACGLGPGGAAYCWGDNSAGQLGDGTTTSSATPIAVAGGLSFAALNAGVFHTCGVTPTGAAYCWGLNNAGQLGDGTQTNSATPVAVSGGLSFATVSPGGIHTCGVTVVGAAYCWGGNASGQLGNGTTTRSATPVAVAGGLTFQTVSASTVPNDSETVPVHTCGVTTGGVAYCWGNNIVGQLGNGTTTGSSVPVAVAGGLAFASVSVGNIHSCGVTTVGAAYCWGENGFGQLGNGTRTASSTPVAVTGGLTFSTVSSGAAEGCGITSAPVMNTADCWGDNGDGQLGNTSIATLVSFTPVAPSGGLTFGEVSASSGRKFTCAVTTANAAYCWGENFSGELGNGTTADSPIPVAVSNGIAFAAVSGGNDHTCGVTTTNSAYCWGANPVGQLGDGTTTNSATPVAVFGSLAFATVSSGNSFTCGLTTVKAAYCWGVNDNGQLGNGTTTNSSTPTAVSGSLAFATVSSGDDFACGVTTAGAGYCWGAGFAGQLGNGMTTNSLTPVPVSNNLAFSTISAGGATSCGVTTAGAAYCWGDNFFGQFGNGTTNNRSSVPVAVSGGLTFAMVSASSHTCGITTANVAYCWGDNSTGQLGNGTTTNSSMPVAVSGGLPFVAISATGAFHACGVTTLGALYCWGGNGSGQLGNGPAFSLIPVSVATVS